MNKTLVPILLAALLGGCHEATLVHGPGTAEADGIYRGVFSDPGSHKSLRAHVLDGLVLAWDSGGSARFSGDIRVDDGWVSGDFQRRDSAGERLHDYRLDGELQPQESIEASLDGHGGAAELSLFYDHADSETWLYADEMAGLWVMDENGLGLVLSIDEAGWIEGSDSAGCGYQGFVDANLPDSQPLAVSLEIYGCAIEGGAWGIAALRERGGYTELVLPVWMDRDDRVESWVLERRS